MKKSIPLALVLIGATSMSVAVRAEQKSKPKFEDRKTEILKHIDERLAKMQEHRTKLDEHRTCVSAAIDQAALTKCHDSMKAFMKEHRGDMKKMRGKMHEEHGEGHDD